MNHPTEAPPRNKKEYISESRDTDVVITAFIMGIVIGGAIGALVGGMFL